MLENKRPSIKEQLSCGHRSAQSILRKKNIRIYFFVYSYYETLSNVFVFCMEWAATLGRQRSTPVWFDCMIDLHTHNFIIASTHLAQNQTRNTKSSYLLSVTLKMNGWSSSASVFIWNIICLYWQSSWHRLCVWNSRKHLHLYSEIIR